MGHGDVTRDLYPECFSKLTANTLAMETEKQELEKGRCDFAAVDGACGWI